MEYTLLNRAQKVKFMREAAMVRRCHTVMHQDPTYNVGLHTFNMLAMLRLFRPDAPVDLIWAIVEHDIPERLTGDIPSPAKWAGVVDSQALTLLEMDILEWVGMNDSVQKLSESDAQWLRGLDLLELYLWGLDQISLGNQNLRVMKLRIEKFVKANPEVMPTELLAIMREASGMEWITVPDMGDQN